MYDIRSVTFSNICYNSRGHFGLIPLRIKFFIVTRSDTHTMEGLSLAIGRISKSSIFYCV